MLTVLTLGASAPSDVHAAIGENFGENLAQVMIGGDDCSNVTHGPGSLAQSMLTCTLKQGYKLDVSVVVST